MRVKILYWGGVALTWIISKLIFRIAVRGREHIPKSGGFILASNHISYWDPPLVGSWSTREMAFFAKAELFEGRIFGNILRRMNALPVKRGAIDRNAIRAASQAVENGFGLVVFPEGTRSKTDQFLEPKPGIGLIALRCPCPIVPAYIHGSNRGRDCFLGKDRMSITFGPPIPLEWVAAQESSKEGYQTIAERVMGEIGKLKEGSAS